MRTLRRVLMVGLASALLLTACGSTAQSNRSATINAALRRLQVEVERQRGKLDHELRRELGGSVDTLGTAFDVYSVPPRGIGQAEWQAAVKNDRTLQRLFASVSRRGPPQEQPSTREVERSRREGVESQRRHSRHAISRRRGALRSVHCRETTRGVWFCTLRFDKGVVVERAAWYQNAAEEGVSIVSERG
jgi:hypothetical protein